MTNQDEVVLTRDTFLDELGLRPATRHFTTVEQVDQMYRIVMEFLSERATVAPQDPDPIEAELPLRLRSFHVRLSRPLLDELTNLGHVAALLLGAAGVAVENWPTITIASVYALSQRVTRLQAEFGERSIIESLAEVERPTTQEAWANLALKTCRRPDAGCRFLISDSSQCGLTVEATQQTIDHLVEKDVLQVRNAVPPHEYRIAT